MGKNNKLLSILMAVVFLIGLGIMLYPYFQGASVDSALEQEAQSFYERYETTSESTEVSDLKEENMIQENERLYLDLLTAMNEYNRTLWEEKQSGLCDPWSYQQPSFSLQNFGIKDEVFGVISIPKLELNMPLYLGATRQHLAAGAAHLSQTSLPIGGENTNCVIAGHCGWGGAAYFRYITDLQPGDQVIITNLWEQITYVVVDTQIIEPHEIEKILIQEGRSMLTLLTCHPYASGGKQRFLVYCEQQKIENFS